MGGSLVKSDFATFSAYLVGPPRLGGKRSAKTDKTVETQRTAKYAERKSRHHRYLPWRFLRTKRTSSVISSALNLSSNDGISSSPFVTIFINSSSVCFTA